MVPRPLHRAHAGAGRRLAADRGRPGRAAHRAHRLRQDPRGVPGLPRPALPRGGGGPAGGPDRDPLRLAAQGALQRRAAQPGRAARRAGRGRGGGRPARARDPHRGAHRRHARARAAADRAPPAARAGDHARVALHPAHRGVEPALARATCAPSSWTRSTRWRATSAARTWRCRSSGSAELVAARGARLQRIGLSATVRPIQTAARLLVGADRPLPEIVNVGQRRDMDLAIEVLGDELGAVCTNEQWEEIYDRVAELARAHRSTLVFVNTRRLVERVTRHLAERLGAERVAAHHSSLSRAAALRRRAAAQGGAALARGGDRVARARDRRGHGGSHLPDRLAPLDRHRAPARRPLGPRPDRHAQGPPVPAHPRPARRVRGPGARGPPRRDRPPQPARRAARRPRPADRGDLRLRGAGRGPALRAVPPRRAVRGARPRGLRPGGGHAVRGHRDPAGPVRGAPAPRRRGATPQGPARRAPGRAHLRRRDPGQRELRGRAGARRDDDRLARRGLRDRVHGGRRDPARQQLLAHPPHRERPRARRGRGRRALHDPVLARRGAGAHARAVRRALRGSPGRGAIGCTIRRAR